MAGRRPLEKNRCRPLKRYKIHESFTQSKLYIFALNALQFRLNCSLCVLFIRCKFIFSGAFLKVFVSCLPVHPSSTAACPGPGARSARGQRGRAGRVSAGLGVTGENSCSRGSSGPIRQMATKDGALRDGSDTWMTLTMSLNNIKKGDVSYCLTYSQQAA